MSIFFLLTSGAADLGILKQLLMLHIIYSKRGRSPPNALAVMSSSNSGLTGDVLVSVGTGDGAGGAAESKSAKLPRGFPQWGEALLPGDVQGSSGSMLSPDGSRWVRLGLWKWINPPVGPLYHSVSSLPKSSPLFPGLICTKERRALASQLLYYATIKPFKDFVCCFPFRMGSERRYWAGFFLDG